MINDPNAMSDDGSLQNDIDELDGGYGHVMAYFGHLVASDLRSVYLDPASQLATHNRNHTVDQQHLNPVFLAWRSLASAGEHAGFAEHMRYITGGGVVARPHASLARVALLGAARAIFVLEPESALERVVRAAKLANKEASDAQKLRDQWGAQTDIPADFLTNLEGPTKDLGPSAAKILVGAQFREKTTINDLDLLISVAPQLSDVFDTPEAEVLAFWNRASGVAHARSWIWNTPHGHIHPQFDFIDTWKVPIQLLLKAWALWNLRRGVTDPSHLPPDGWVPDRKRWDGASDEG